MGSWLGGIQGASVAEALLADGTFAVRATTPHPTGTGAAELRQAGAEVVYAELEDERSVESALRGAYGAFVVSNFWEHSSLEREIIHGKRVADVSKRLGLTLVVFSGLENVMKMTGGKLEVLTFDGKCDVEAYFRELDVPMTNLRIPNYFETLLTYFRPQKITKDTYMLPIPMGEAPMDGFSVKDLGEVVLSIFKCPAKYSGLDIGLSTGKLTTEQYADMLSNVLGKKIRDGKVTPELYEQLTYPGVEEIANSFRFYRLKPSRDVELTFELNPRAKTFEEWLQLHKDELAALC